MCHRKRVAVCVIEKGWLCTSWKKGDCVFHGKRVTVLHGKRGVFLEVNVGVSFLAGVWCVSGCPVMQR